MLKNHPSSFRDPGGCIFERDGSLYRRVNHEGKESYRLLMDSGLYAELVKRGWLVSHVEEVEKPLDIDCYLILKPDYLDFISYPYEWSFSQLQDAALLTLNIQKLAIEYGMTLKDGTAFNVQFHNGKPIFIDTLSFEAYIEGEPWSGYHQFCRHFYAPLLLISKKDIRLGVVLKNFIDGIPLDLTSTLLPLRSWFSLRVLVHVHLHARAQSFSWGMRDKLKNKTRRLPVSRNGMLGIVDSLQGAIKSIIWHPFETEWFDYYQNNNYSVASISSKSQVISKFLDKILPNEVWDLGSNTGYFSRLASMRGVKVISFDLDPAAVEINYRSTKYEGTTNILPLILDISNPSPAIGWENKERMSLFDRGPVDCVFALALIHHLVITKNIPLALIASFFSKICTDLIIEFIPKTDSQVKRLLESRKDIFQDYSEQEFLNEFSNFFEVRDKALISDSHRTLYWLRKNL